MRASWKTVSAFAVGAVMGLAAAGCQTYDFEPVEPISIKREAKEQVLVARNLKPNVMLLVDKSGSMDLPVDQSLAACQDSDGSPCGESRDSQLCPSTCPTRWTDLQSAMASFLTSADTGFFRLGMTTFPQATSVTTQCSPSTSTLVNILDREDATQLQSHAGQLLAQLQGIGSVDTTSYGADRTGGGTPTALSLKYIRENVPALQDTSSGRANFVILLTDGLPNCDPTNPTLGDLDKDGPVAEITALREKGVRTIVVGFGADTAGGEGPEILRAMATAGGYQRTCQVATDCGTGTCEAGLCSEPYFQASSGEQLAAALRKIAGDILVGDPCTFKLDTQPSDPSLLSVRINEERLPAVSADGTVNWTYQDPNVIFHGAVCEQIKASTPANPVKVAIISVQAG